VRFFSAWLRKWRGEMSDADILARTLKRHRIVLGELLSITCKHPCRDTLRDYAEEAAALERAIARIQVDEVTG
jgi:hypothetical protein